MSRPEHRVRVLQVAEDDLAEILTYVAVDRPGAAEALADRFEVALSNLARHPRAGRVPSEEELARIGYRYLVVEKYLLFYMVEGETVYVHRIVHGARDYLGLL